jgi:hypothetical protein
MSDFINLEDYLQQLKKRKKQSKVYKKYQLDGLSLATLLKDQKHKALYIKLAKELNSEKLIEIAKQIIENKKIKNYGAYFMWKLKKENLLKNLKFNKKTKKPIMKPLFKIKKNKKN